MGKGRHMFFLPLLFGTHFVKILSWKNFWFPKFPFLGIGLGLYHVGPHQVEFPSLKPLEPESILSKWSKSLYSGQELKSSSWGPGFGPRPKLYMVFNTPRWVGLVRVLNRKSAKKFGGLFSPVLAIGSLKCLLPLSTQEFATYTKQRSEEFWSILARILTFTLWL